MHLKIHGGYWAYLYVVLLQFSIVYLQRLDWNRSITEQPTKISGTLVDDYLLATRFVATGLSGVSWLLAVYVAEKYGLASAALFLALGLGTSILAMVLIPPLPRIDMIAHIVSLPATAYLFSEMLLALGIGAGL